MTTEELAKEYMEKTERLYKAYKEHGCAFVVRDERLPHQREWEVMLNCIGRVPFGEGSVMPESTAVALLNLLTVLYQGSPKIKFSLGTIEDWRNARLETYKNLTRARGRGKSNKSI